MTPEPKRAVRPLVDRRTHERRQSSDRRTDVRWEPEKSDRRKRGIAADRRKGAIWGSGRKA